MATEEKKKFYYLKHSICCSYDIALVSSSTQKNVVRKSSLEK